LNNKANIRHLGQEQIAEALQEMGEPAFRAKQIWQWLWQKGVTDWAEMTNLSKALHQKLADRYDIFNMVPATTQLSTDGTVKYAFKLHDGEVVEGVLIPQEKRMTACISSQVGCSLSCTFCATSRLTRKRNLYYDEIYDQVIWLHKAAMKYHNTPLTNVVFMGMGEPLLNYSQVSKGIERITAPDGFNFSPKRITVSTAGIAKMIHKLGDEQVKYNLALSLHAATDEKRSQIMGINDTNSIAELREALIHYIDATNNRVTLEYTLLANFNDSLVDADALALFAKGLPCKVNLIEYNPIDDGQFTRSSGNAMHRFKARLEESGIITNIRRSRGEDIDAACGQLANKNDAARLTTLD